jgi:hypothetical protein
MMNDLISICFVCLSDLPGLRNMPQLWRFLNYQPASQPAGIIHCNHCSSSTDENSLSECSSTRQLCVALINQSFLPSMCDYFINQFNQFHY